MRRLHQSWNQTMIALGLRAGTARKTKRSRPINSAILRGEYLEDRRMLATWFERTDGWDQWASIHPSAYVAGYFEAFGVDDFDPVYAAIGGVAEVNVEYGFSQDEEAFVAQNNTPHSGTTNVPTVQAAGQHALTLDLDDPWDAWAGNGYGGSAHGMGAFTFGEDDVATEFTFHGVLFIAAYGDTFAESGDVVSDEFMSVSADIGTPFGNFFVQSISNGDGTWNFSTNVPGYADDPRASRPEGYYPFTVENITDGMGFEFDSTAYSSNRLFNPNDGPGFGQSQWELVASAWGSITPESDTPPPGDFNGDGSVDDDDFGIWAENEGAGPGGEDGPDFGTLTKGDADFDGDVDEDDLAIWANSAANAPTGKIFLVSSEGDTVDADRTYGNLTLREALAMSDASAGDDDIIMFGPGIDLITLGSALSIADEVSIVGPGAEKLAVSGNNASRVFTVSNGITAAISGITIADGLASGSSLATYGGGIFSDGNLTLDSVDVVGNYANGYGGGVFSHSSGTLTIINSTFDDNEAGSGGGALSGHFRTGAALSISGSTFSNNVASGGGAGGGAIWHHSSSGGTSTFTIESSTFSGNQAKGGGAIYFQTFAGTTVTGSIQNSTIAYNTAAIFAGGGITNLNGATITLHNTILANNTAGDTTYHDVWGTLTGGGASSYNLIGQVGGSGLVNNTNGNKVGTTGTRIDALLAPLGDYGGRTQTHALKTSSPAIDTGKGSLSNLEDQRGYTREVDLSTTNGADGYRDIGAYEAGAGTTLIVRSDGDRNNSVSDKATTDSLRLREAIALATTLAGTETIAFDKSSWVDNEIQLSSTWGQLYVSDGVTIEGPGANALTIAAAPSSRVFQIDNNVTLKGMRITGGNVTGDGGGVYVDGDATLDGVQIDHNTASGQGGAIYTSGNTELTLKNSTLWSNDAGGQGGGLYVDGFVDATVFNSTISDNESGSQGGGIYRASLATLRVVNATIAFNRAATGGGGIHSASTSTRLDNTIVSNNTSTGGAAEVSGTFNSSSKNNLIRFDSVTLNGIDNGEDGNRVGGEGFDPALDARLLALADYGGTTLTHALNASSEAVDNGDDGIAASFSLFDQRGFDRDVDGVDIGAFEVAIGEVFSYFEL